MHLFSRLSLASLLLVACDPAPEEGCTSDSECAADQLCRDEVCMDRGDGGGLDAGTDAGRADAGTDAGTDAGRSCSEDCGDGACIDGMCCEAVRSCGDVCCGAAAVCSFGRCQDIGESCAGAEDCDDGSYCELSLGEPALCGDVASRSGRCLSLPPACEDGTEPDPAAPECVSSCRFVPPSGDLNVELRYTWGGFDGDRAAPNLSDVRNSPIVINLDDDDCDGRITARDVPEIVVITSPDDTNRPDGSNAVGDLVVLAVTDGALTEKWRVPGIAQPWTYPAAGNIDGMPGNEIVVCSVDRTVIRAYGVNADASDLELLWTSPTLAAACTMPSLADLDQDGDVEVLTRGGVLDGVTGAIEFTFDMTPGSTVFASDVDGDVDHRLEVISPRRIYRLESGTLTTIADTGVSANHHLVAQLDGTGNPEIVSLRFADRTMRVWRYAPGEPGNFETVRLIPDINGALDPLRCAESTAGRTQGGGPPTAGDVNNDGVPDIAVAGGVGYAVFDGAKLVDPTVTDPLDTFFWADDTVDCSSAQTGSSVFDFNGDGRVEVLYADEHTFRIYEGATGDVLFDTCNTNGTILEQPIVADVDNDGQADIVVVANARYRSCLDDASNSISGVRVFSSRDGDWVRTRRVWNQHPYHITNIDEDGTVPQREPANWDDPALNDFRLNRQPGDETAAADLVVTLEPRCSGGLGLVATAINLGEAVAPPGARVAVYRGTPPSDGSEPPATDLLGEGLTTLPLYPAQSEQLEFDLASADASIVTEGSPEAFAIIVAPDGLVECRPDNGVATLVRLCTLR
ncbi:MAG: FG-GAP repeat domain-containing protein [Sandaracinaceae bacterium]